MQPLLRRSHLARAPVVLAAALTGAVVASDWPWPGTLSKFWDGHSMFAGVVSGVILLFIGYLVVEAWLAAGAARKWMVVRAVAFKALGKAADDVRNGLEELITGAYPTHERSPQPPALAERLRKVVRRHERELRALATTDHDRRVAVLAGDREWATIAVDAVDALKHIHRDQLAKWGAIMLATDQLAGVLNRMAALNERVFELQAPLRRLRDADDRAEVDAARAEAVRRWQTVCVETVYVQEQLMRLAVDPRWVHHAGRARLSGQSLDALEARHRADPFPVPRLARAEDPHVAGGVA